MMRPEIRLMAAEHLGEAAAMLAARHRAHRAVMPLLSSQYEDPSRARAELERWWEQEGASGAVALSEGRLTGYLLGSPKTAEHWGPNVWVEGAGQAATEPEILRDLYAVAAQRWVEEGRTAHYVITPSFDRDAIDAWFHLGFGLQFVHALRESAGPPAVSCPPGVKIRTAEERDVPLLAELDLLLPRHQAESPVFSSGTIPPLEEVIEEWREGFDDPDYHTLVADIDGSGVGLAVGASVERSQGHTGLCRPDEAAILGYVAVSPDARGRGIGQALGSAIVEWASQAGYPITVTDWRATNLLSSRTWPRLGFAETFLRLHRVVGF